MTKKKTKRSKSKTPNLDPSLNLKSRRDILDSRHYINGVKNREGEVVMPPLDEKAQKFLDIFVKEFYNADFSGDENVHTTMIDLDTLEDIKTQIRAIKAKRKRIWSKSSNTTTDEDRELANHFTEQIDDMEYFLNNMYPKRAAEHANNQRNRDLLNYAKRSNKYNLVSWDELRDEEENKVVSEFDEVMENEFDDEN